ncbi:MAG: hypothetical protein EXQ58_05665 [Acidobacteria bacterium]|nr:hypothetical protein [Acidobacteriota bacterium]
MMRLTDSIVGWARLLRKIPGCALILALAFCPAALQAAEDGGGISVLYGGSSYAKAARLPQDDLRGFVVGGSLAQNRWLQWTGEMSVQYAPSNLRHLQPVDGAAPIEFNLNQSVGACQLGPEFTRHTGRKTWFDHSLAGYGMWQLGNSDFFWKKGGLEGFMISAGGSPDVRLSRRFGFRIIQVDYSPFWPHTEIDGTYITPPLPPKKSVYHNLRIGLSVVISRAR